MKTNLKAYILFIGLFYKNCKLSKFFRFLSPKSSLRNSHYNIEAKN